MTAGEFVVVGLGAMGSATAFQLARRGRDVLAIDQYSPPHIYGSSHGETRITRCAIGEAPHYSPLALRSHEIWREIEAETGSSLLTTTGGLILSSSSRTARLHVDDFFANTLAAARRFGIAHELLDTQEIRRRFPQFRVRDGEQAYFEPGAGFLRPEACIAAQLQLATRFGAQIREHERVLRFEPLADGVLVHTGSDTIRTGKLILCAGPWLPQLLGPRYGAPFRILRQVLFWFAIGDFAAWSAEHCPVYIWELQGPDQAIYGFPAIDGPPGGIKIATQQYEKTTTPDAVERDVPPAEIAAMHRLIAPFFAGLTHDCLKAVTCLYTQTPDSGFVICPHPDSDRILIASPCSGHGFKHSAAIGELLADMATGTAPHIDISPFSLSRFLQ
ncbi:MAG TPA: N-methyl-L-tryptophan oxidase [Micropepsaceae bacterium]|nr:N-methyl-L-tryptophan oxidase [Micropepsaceae bacterium]